MSLNSPPDLPISFYLLKNCKLWVWDFDDTLIDSTTYIKRDMKPSKIRIRTDAELDIEVPQWRYFKRLVEFLVSHGRYVGIASFGTYEIIYAYLDRIMGFNQKYFNKNNIIAPCFKDREDRAFSLPPHKNEYIYALMKTYKVEDFKRVVLFDDMASNISEATGIGVVAIQISTPRNGDSENLYFGPWNMEDFDNKIENDCGKEIYLNRTFTGVSNKNNEDTTDYDKIPFFGPAFDKIDFGMGVQEKFRPMAFGTGIGSRKVNTMPEYKWNSMNVKNPPLWKNGNWSDSSSTLGGISPSFWDNHQSVGNYTSDDGKMLYQNIKPYNMNIEAPSNNYIGVAVEGFDNNINARFEKSRAQNNYNNNLNIRKRKNNSNNKGARESSVHRDEPLRGAEALVKGARESSVHRDEPSRGAEALAQKPLACDSCGKLDYNWIILVLMVIIAMMALIVFNVM